MNNIEKIKQLVTELNIYRDAYYNNSESLVSDKVYDELFDELTILEKETGYILANSPTQTVGYDVVSKLNKVTHDHPMLSLDKTKDVNKIIQFLDGKSALAMAKMDGLTCSIKYIDGKLVSAETRGNGVVGEDITHNIKFVDFVPLTIDAKDEIVVDGEIIITKSDFQILKEKYRDPKGKTYKNARNLASGSVRLLDSKESAQRKLKFIAWKFERGYTSNSFLDNLWQLAKLGFTPVTHVPMQFGQSKNKWDIEAAITSIKDECNTFGYGIDGIVFGFNDVEYGKSLGVTSHHARNQIAYKFEDDKYDTTVRDIDWTMGKTGVLTPTAIFDPVDIDGTDVCRASLHNLTIMEQLNITKNCTAYVYKANMIIPQIENVDDDGDGYFDIPAVCPICGGATIRVKENDSEMLMCGNPTCSGKLLGKLCAFVAKDAMDIDGLSEGKLTDLMSYSLIGDILGIYRLRNHSEQIKQFPGWGETSVNKLLDSIEKSKTVKLENLITALSIPNIGLASAKVLAGEVDYDLDVFIACLKHNHDFSYIEGFGEKTNTNIYDWFKDNEQLLIDLSKIVTIVKPNYNEDVNKEGPLSGHTFCITGTFNESRSELQKILENLGGTFVSGVTKKTDILFAGQKAGSKLKKAQDLGITIYDYDETYNFLEVNGY